MYKHSIVFCDEMIDSQSLSEKGQTYFVQNMVRDRLLKRSSAPAGPRNVATGEAKRNPWTIRRT
jgi:hypothetical protein